MHRADRGTCTVVGLLIMIPRNPLTMVGRLSRCWLFTYRTPIDTIVPLLPSPLEPVSFGDFAFWNIVVCKVENMRPRLSPVAFGISYWHIGYRIYVKVRTESRQSGQPGRPGQSRHSESVEGQYFARSDCDNGLISMVGNILTDYNFHSAAVEIKDLEGKTEIDVRSDGGHLLSLIDRQTPARLSEYSPFKSIEEASDFLKYKPNGISVSKPGSINVVHIVRDEERWKSTPIHVETMCSQVIAEHQNCYPELAFEVDPIDYQWNRGEQMKSEPSSK